MCATCGCSAKDQGHHHHPHEHEHGHEHTHDHGHEHTHEHGHEHPHKHGHEHDHEHPHEHGHEHPHEHGHEHPPRGRLLSLEEEVLQKNSRLAEQNRGWLRARGILALNLVSSPGAGKTTLLERMIGDLAGKAPLAVIEGDQETSRDADRIRQAGARAVQINTATGCHLDAAMVRRALDDLAPAERSCLFIENVGNLVCPALFDLGERAKVAILSVTEGEDKPLKYPHMFRASEVLLLNKVDLLPHLDFEVDRCLAFARQVNPRLRVFQVSAKSGFGLPAFYDWLLGELSDRRPAS